MNISPIRYRGYYFDSEISMYYLQSRYYNPRTARFLNADDTDLIGLLSQQSIIGSNLFTYCENDSVNDRDGNGRIAQAIVGAIVSGIIAFALYYLEYWLKMRR